MVETLSFFRNREIRTCTIILTILAVILITAGFLISRQAGILIIIAVFLLCTCFYLFTFYRYKQIESLSEYLRRISSGEYSLDIRDNHEGELSILKSEIYKVTLMLSEYNEQLKQEKVILADHMADISHQIKTPLTSMMVMIDLLEDENLSEQKRKEFILHLQVQLERIEWLVSSLLKVSKLDAGVVEMNKKDVSVKTLIDKAINPLLISMELKDIQYIYNYSSEQLKLSCDVNWTAEALTNILKNCIEHTPEGGKIYISAQDNPLYKEIKIVDNGVGISKEDLPHIFTRFYKGKNSSPDSVGIGLAMSKSIIRNQGGDIIVKSELGKGSEFTVRLYKSII
ncbi:MAG: HAMP domain-containing sensor histidine kinase [Clostridia bacterium]|nr:HAMP domain-containing sensor histidine kinase [Clostridia bacterium]